MKDISHIIEEIIPTLEGLESSRRLYLKRRAIYLTVLFVPLIALIAMGVIQNSIGWFFGAAGWCVLGIILYQVRAGSIKSAYCTNYKNTVVPSLLSLIDPQLSFDPSGGIASSAFVNTELFNKSPDRYKSEDMIDGKYGSTFLHLAEVHAEDRQTTTDSKGRTRTRYVTIFKGLLLIADFNKHFHGRTFVFPDTAEKLFGDFGRILQKLGGRRETALIRMEDPDFEKRFVVHATDAVEARYILSTSLMRRLIEMRDRFGKDVRMGFKDSSVMLAVPHQRAFLEPETGTQATDTAQIQRMLDELRYFLDTIEELDLNTRIWTKQ